MSAKIGDHHCVLALMTFDGSSWTEIKDCRSLFPPVTELTSLFYVGGDGQEAMPQQPTLPQALQVGVANGKWPVQGARVRFTVAPNNGTVNGSQSVEVRTDAAGLATCTWVLSPGTRHQTAEARLIDAGGNTQHIPIRFNAILSIADAVHYDATQCAGLAKAGVTTVQEAIDALCRRESAGCRLVVGDGGTFRDISETIEVIRERKMSDACVCLLPGTHALPTNIDERELRLHIIGCGPGSVLALPDRGTSLSGLADITIRDVAINTASTALTFSHCGHVEISSCRIEGRTAGTVLLIDHAARFLCEHNVIRSFVPAAREGISAVLDFEPEVAKVFHITDDVEFETAVDTISEDIAARPVATRREFTRQLRSKLPQPITPATASTSSKNSTKKKAATKRASTSKATSASTVLTVEAIPVYNELLELLEQPRSKASDVKRVFLDLRRLAMLEEAGLALTILGPRTACTLLDNHIHGSISLGGMPGDLALNEKSGPLLRQRLSNKDIPVSLKESSFAVWLRGNRFTRLLSAVSMKEVVALINSQTKESFDVMQSVHLTDNIIDGTNSSIVARHVSLQSTRFRATRSTVASIIADTAIYLGNSSVEPVDVIDASKQSERVANVNMAVV